MEPVQVIHHLVHRVNKDCVLAPALDVLSKEFVGVADLGLNIRLDYLNIALDPLLVDAIEVLTYIVLVTQLNDAVIRLHVLARLHHQSLGGEVLQNCIAI